MSSTESDKSIIRLKVDPANPGQFFACCGLLEIAERLWNGVEGWFEGNSFCCRRKGRVVSLSEVLNAVRNICFENGDNETSSEDTDESDSATDKSFKPIVVEKPIQLLLDWWTDKSLKTWAGSMNERLILLAMCNAIDIDNPDPFSQSQVVFDALQKNKKREPFYFDARRGANALAGDVGFAPDALKMRSAAFPVVEAFCFFGLQRCRPMRTVTNRVFEYCTWQYSLPMTLVPLAVCGILPQLEYQKFRFENAFRTDQKKHKAFTPATPLKGEGI